MAIAGFYPLKSNTSMYIRKDPHDPKRRTIVDMCVDDGQIISFAKDQVADLKATLTKRYGEKEPITWNDVSSGYKGMQISRSPSGAVTYDITKYTLGYLDRAGMDQVPAALTPSDTNFFDSPTDPTPYHDPATYAKLCGGLTYIAGIKYDIRKESGHLQKFISAPTVSDYLKLVRVLRYLKGCPELGITFYTHESPRLYGYSDTSYAVHTDGRCQNGAQLQIGTDNAPFWVSSTTQKETIATCPSESEYCGLTTPAKRAQAARQLLEELGFPQDITIIKEDNLPAIRMAKSVDIPKKSRHIAQRFHYIRDLIKQQVLALQHCSTHDMLADFYTKSLPPSLFLYFRSKVLNTNKRNI
jgi:hypothetical protein